MPEKNCLVDLQNPDARVIVISAFLEKVLIQPLISCARDAEYAGLIVPWFVKNSICWGYLLSSEESVKSDI